MTNNLRIHEALVLSGMLAHMYASTKPSHTKLLTYVTPSSEEQPYTLMIQSRCFTSSIMAEEPSHLKRQ